MNNLSSKLKCLYKPIKHYTRNQLNSKLLFCRCLSNQSSLNLSGIYPPIPTPFRLNEDIAWVELSHNLTKWGQHSFKGYVVQGSNGEYVSLSHEERIEMVKFVRENVPKEKLILAGSGCEGTRETLKLTLDMADVGADAALIATPSFFKSRMNSAAMMKHYSTIADNSPIPVILYNVPSNTGVDFPLDAIVSLSRHPNIIGLKDSGGNVTNIGSIIHDTRNEDFQVIAGSASFLLATMQLGAVGGICALANVLGEQCCRLYDMIERKEFEEAKKFQLTLIAPNQAVTRKYNVPALKYAMELYGYYGGPARSPLTDLNDAEKKDVRDCFDNFFII